MLSTSLIYEIVLATHAIQNFHSQIQAHDLCNGPAYCVLCTVLCCTVKDFTFYVYRCQRPPHSRAQMIQQAIWYN